MSREQEPKKGKGGGWRRVPVSRQARSLFLRRAAILIGLIPLWEMTQVEVTWAFKQRMRLAT